VPGPAQPTPEHQRDAHSGNPACAPCHSLIDPVGFGFERYDGLGRYRTSENNLPVDDTGALTGSEDADGPFQGVVELARRLAGSNQVHRCVATQAFRYAFGRRETMADAMVLAAMTKEFEGAKLDVRELVMALVHSERFVKRPGEE
jgi:hypothetical protein